MGQLQRERLCGVVLGAPILGAEWKLQVGVAAAGGRGCCTWAWLLQVGMAATGSLGPGLLLVLDDQLVC